MKPDKRRLLWLCTVLLALAATGAAIVLCDAFEKAVETRRAGIVVPETGREILDRSGRLLMAFTAPDERWRLDTGAEVDQRYLAMLLMWEDKRFHTHGGVDLRAVARAVWQGLRHRRIVSGASTLTMQTARLVARLSPGSWSGKREQVLTAFALERQYDKHAILSLYLKLAPFGGNLEGVRAASLAWFGTEPRRLTAAQAALLVALPQSPERLRPDRHPHAAKIARDRVLIRARDARLIDTHTLERALAEPLPTHRRAMPAFAPHVCVRLAAQTKRLRLKTTLDRDLQEALERLSRNVGEGLARSTSLAMVALDVDTGQVLASIGGPDRFDPSRAGHVDLTQAVRSPGSALKPFIYGLAFENGQAHPDSIVSDRPASFGGYRPGNFDGQFAGDMSVREALRTSRNLPAVELLGMVGPQRFLARLHEAGIPLHMEGHDKAGLAIALGGAGLTLTNLTALYAGLADGGKVRQPVFLPNVMARPARLLSPTASWYLTSILSGSPATTAKVRGRIAFKTGTSYGYRDAWAVGYDGKHAVGLWVGRPDGAPVAGATGEATALPVLIDAFKRLGPSYPLPSAPTGTRLTGTSLPAALVRIGRAARKGDANAPQIAFPPNGADIEITARDTVHLPLKVLRGRPPFTWYVDGAPVLRHVFLRNALHRLTGPGFLQISVVDATGRSATTHIRAQ